MANGQRLQYIFFSYVAGPFYVFKTICFSEISDGDIQLLYKIVLRVLLNSVYFKIPDDSQNNSVIGDDTSFYKFFDNNVPKNM